MCKDKETNFLLYSKYLLIYACSNKCSLILYILCICKMLPTATYVIYNLLMGDVS